MLIIIGLFLLPGVLFFTGRGAGLIAGYNTMSANATTNGPCAALRAN